MDYSVYYINFNNKNSYQDLDLIMEKRPDIPVPKRNINLIPIEGRNGTLCQDLGTYDDIEIPIQFALADFDNMQRKARVIKKWLAGGLEDYKLTFDDDLDNFFIVKQVKLPANLTRILEAIGRFTATFVCEPFAYSYNGQNIITLTQPDEVFNNGTESSTPLIKVYGDGEVILTINSKSVYLTIDEYIEIDSELQQVFKGTLPRTDKMKGDYPIFTIGSSNISWIGNVTKVEITPRWRWL